MSNDGQLEFHTGVVAPKGVWWRPASRQERLWVAIAFVWFVQGLRMRRGEAAAAA